MIDCQSVSVTIKGKKLLDDISVHFSKGHIHGIVGRNGSGKTMLIKALSGYLRPNGGRIVIEGKELYKDIFYPPSLGLIIEIPAFSNFSTGRQNLKYLANIRKQIGDAQVNRALAIVGLEDSADKLVRQYSLGMKQRLGLAQAIMENPALLLLDEPFNGLDKRGLTDMYALFKDLRQQGKTIILASHSSQDINALCDTVHEMENGKLHSL